MCQMKRQNYKRLAPFIKTFFYSRNLFSKKQQQQKQKKKTISTKTYSFPFPYMQINLWFTPVYTHKQSKKRPTCSQHFFQ